MIQLTDIQKSYGNLDILKGVKLNVKNGETVSIVGASGAGKTTLLQIIGTLDTPDRGKLSIDGKQTQNLKESSLSKFRNKHIGFVFQFHNLLEEFSALENICIPAFIAGIPKHQAEEDAMALLKNGKLLKGQEVDIPLENGNKLRAKVVDPQFYDIEGQRQNV